MPRRITRSIVPNLLTLANLFSGFVSIIYASNGDYTQVTFMRLTTTKAMVHRLQDRGPLISIILVLTSTRPCTFFSTQASSGCSQVRTFHSSWVLLMPWNCSFSLFLICSVKYLIMPKPGMM